MSARLVHRALPALAAALALALVLVRPAWCAVDPPAPAGGASGGQPAPERPAPPPADPAPASQKPAPPPAGPAPSPAKPASAAADPAPAPRADPAPAAPASPAPPPPPAEPQGASSPTAALEPAPLPKPGFALDVLGGGQVVVDDEDSAMFLKYQDVAEPLVLPGLYMRVRSWDTDFRLDAVDVAEDDAVYRFSASHPGLFYASIGWDELPHHLSDQETTTLYSVSGGDRLLIEDKIQQRLQAQAFRLEEFLNQHAHPVEIETNRKTARARASFSPYPGLTLSFQDEKEEKSGSNSRSVSTNFNNGADIDEFPDPLDYETHRVELGLELRMGSAWVAASASVIDFENAADRLLVDNPLRFQDSLGASFGNRSAKTFLVSTPPDSEARDVSAQAGFALPHNMRITGSYTSGRVDATTTMRDYTSNNAARINPFYPDLPSSTIDAVVRTTSYDFAFTGTPLKWLSFRAFARGYDYDNQTPVYTFPGYVIADTQISTLDRRALPYGWGRDGQGIDLRVRPLRNLAFGVGYQHESVDHTFREVESSDEDIVRINVDYTFRSWLTLHGDGAWSDRTADDYSPKAYLQSFPAGVPVAQSRFLLLRRFDVASRDRAEYGVSGAIDFGHGWGFDVESRQRSDDYVDSDYGLVDEGWRNQIVGLTMKINDPCVLRGENANEFATRRVNSRYRPIALGQAIDAGANDWSDEINNKIHTVSGGLVCREVDGDRWDFNAYIDYAKDRQTDDAAFAGHAVFDPNHLAHARNYPDIERVLHRYSGNVRFAVSSHFNVLIGGYYEKFVETDPTQDSMNPTMGNFDPAAFESAYLGVHWESYSVRVFSLLLDAHW